MHMVSPSSIIIKIYLSESVHESYSSGLPSFFSLICNKKMNKLKWRGESYLCGLCCERKVVFQRQWVWFDIRSERSILMFHCQTTRHSIFINTTPQSSCFFFLSICFKFKITLDNKYSKWWGWGGGGCNYLGGKSFVLVD